MERTSHRCSALVEPNDFLKLKRGSDFKNIHFGSLGDLTCTDNKRSNSHLHREDSILSKGSLSSIFKKSFDSPWSSGPVGTYTPKPEKTFAFIETLLATLSDMHFKYSKMTCLEEYGLEHQENNEICLKLDDRMLLIQNLRSFYMSLTENRQAEFDKIESKIRSILSSKASRKSFDIEDNEAYMQICRELLVVESKLERCSGKLQFQIMELDFIGKISPLDQYELSIRLNETTKFKTRIKIERNGYQVWDSRNFSINPTIDDYMYIKFSELKPLNKSTVLTDKKLPFINNLIKAEPSIFTLWLSPVGTIKLKVIVQWNATLEDPGLNACLACIESKILDNSVKNDTIVHIRSATTSHKYVKAHLSSNVEAMFRSDRMMDSLRSISMSNIAEDVEAEKTVKKVSVEIQHEDVANETIDEAIHVTTDLAEPHVQEHSNIKVDIVDENERKIPEERINRQIVLRNERVFVNVIAESESCLDQEIDPNYSKEQDIVENTTMSPKDSPSALIQDIANDYETIDSPIIAVHEASVVSEDGNEEKSLEILETPTSGNLVIDGSISQDHPDFVAGEVICEMEASLLVENMEEEDPAVNISLDISEGIAGNFGDKEFKDIDAANAANDDVVPENCTAANDDVVPENCTAANDDVVPENCTAAIDKKESSDSRVDPDNGDFRISHVIIDDKEAKTDKGDFDHAGDSDPYADLDRVKNSDSKVDPNNEEPRTCGAAEIDHLKDSDPSAGLQRVQGSDPSAGLERVQGSDPNAGLERVQGSDPSAGLDRMQGSDPSAGLERVQDSDPSAGLERVQGSDPNAGLDRMQGSDPSAGPDNLKPRESSISIDDDKSGEDSTIIHNTEPRNSYVTLGNIEPGDCNGLLTDILIAEKHDNVESATGASPDR